MEIGTSQTPRMGVVEPLAVRAWAPTRDVSVRIDRPALEQKDLVTIVREAPVSQIRRPRCPFEVNVMLLSFQERELDEEEEESSTAAIKATEEEQSVQEKVGSAETKKSEPLELAGSEGGACPTT